MSGAYRTLTDDETTILLAGLGALAHLVRVGDINWLFPLEDHPAPEITVEQIEKLAVDLGGLVINLSEQM